MKINKSYIEGSVEMGQILEFETVFPSEERLPIEHYLSGSSRGMILHVAAFFLGFKDNDSRFNDNTEFIRMFFQSENQKFANRVYDKIKEIENNGVRVGIINAYSSLRLFEYYFSRPEEQETQTHAEFEVNLFKAYLALNSDFTQKQMIAFSSAQESPEEIKIPMMLFCSQYPLADISNHDINQIWIVQTIKAIYLFQFLESHEKVRPLLSAFLDFFNSQTWEDFLKVLLLLTTFATKSIKEGHTDIVVEPGEDFENRCSFIEKFIVFENDELDQSNFLTTRAKPFYKVKDGVYRIIFNLFVVEKIFKGIYFLLRDVNKNLPTDKRIKDIRSFYGEEFSEKVLCYKVIESIYSYSCIRFSGQELKDKKIEAAPDYYVRKGKHILLIESKDFLIPADKKMSFDYNVYEEEFARVLDYEELHNGKIKAKAISQLINNIRKILKNDFAADVNYHYKKVFIYPVLLTHDRQYDTPGFHELLNLWFQEALQELADEGLFVYHVKPLSVVNIDSLIYHQVGLANKICLHEVLDIYHQNKKIEKQKKIKFKSREEYERYMNELDKKLISKFAPFSMFIDKYFKEKRIGQLPPILELVTPALFKKNEESNLDQEA